MNKFTLTTLLIYFISSNILSAQSLLKKMTLKKQVDNSSLVVEGKVISKKAYWDNDQKSIYTINHIKIYKVFKGQALKSVEIITPGGSVGLKVLKVYPSLNLNKGDIGIFYLVDNKTQNTTGMKQYKPYGSIQGFYKYNLRQDFAINPFNKKSGISTFFYYDIMNITKLRYTEIRRFNQQIKTSQNKTTRSPSSINFSPTISSAGTKSILTITGTDFGTTKGQVGFSSADDGGNTFINALETQVLTWTDTQIKVEIPSRAGTGKIQISNHSNNSIGLSNEDLNIMYSEFNIESDDVPTKDSGIIYAYQAQHINANNSGGYIWQMQTDFYNDIEFPGAKAAFERAMETWRCNSEINWIISESPSLLDEKISTQDGINIIRFDNGSELDEGVLGVCYSWYSGCITNGPNAEWFVDELDIVFDDNTNWYFGTGLPGVNQYDFETATLHELGHGHQLGHVINTNEDVMHFSTFSGEHQRRLNSNNIEAATTIQKRNTNSSVCSELAMLNYQCVSTGNNEDLESSISVFPVPTKQQFYIKNESVQKLDKVIIFDIRSRLIAEYDVTNNLNIISINLIGISKGVYFINIYSGNKIVTKKLLIE